MRIEFYVSIRAYSQLDLKWTLNGINSKTGSTVKAI